MSGGPYRAPSLLRALLDVRFRWVITPRLIGLLYVSAAGFNAFGCVMGLLTLWGFSAWAGTGWLWFAPVMIAAGVGGVLLSRVACEWLMMTFTHGRSMERPAAPKPAEPPAAVPGRAPGAVPGWAAPPQPPPAPPVAPPSPPASGGWGLPPNRRP
ncbi:DUF4282 domain-containing protein [Actinomadura sp. WAC 06369]|uniref:DUF4282 domain-containing protein n=1 Tax=Actinomadura sp. WAC 06369 TaxID=2203193 RepID=UPI001F18827B|nr:DUF4282 domain-containing protein [Actinomadura sp. WAC 06369]